MNNKDKLFFIFIHVLFFVFRYKIIILDWLYFWLAFLRKTSSTTFSNTSSYIHLDNKRSSLNNCENIATAFNITSSIISSLNTSQVLLNLKDCETTIFIFSAISSITIPLSQILSNLKDCEKITFFFNTILPNKKLSNLENYITFNITCNTSFILPTIPTITSLYTGKRFINWKNCKAFIYKYAKH